MFEDHAGGDGGIDTDELQLMCREMGHELSVEELALVMQKLDTNGDGVISKQELDDALLAKNTKVQLDEQIIEMMNGCLCCTVRQDLVKVLNDLFAKVALSGRKLDGNFLSSSFEDDFKIIQIRRLETFF